MQGWLHCPCPRSGCGHLPRVFSVPWSLGHFVCACVRASATCSVVAVSFMLLLLFSGAECQNEGKVFTWSKDQKCYPRGSQEIVKNVRSGDLLDSVSVTQDALETVAGSEGGVLSISLKSSCLHGPYSSNMKVAPHLCDGNVAHPPLQLSLLHFSSLLCACCPLTGLGTLEALRICLLSG